MLVQFQPQSLDKISPTIRAAEAVNLVAGFDRCHDVQLYCNEETGELRFVGSAERLARWGAASEVLFEAVRAAAVQSYIWSFEQGAYLSIPRFHWNSRGPLDLNSGFQGATDIRGGDASLDGQEVVFSLPELERWLPNGRAEVAARFPAEPIVANGIAESDPKPLPVVTRPELQAWVRERIQAGDTQDAICKGVHGAFEGKRIKLSRDDLRDIHRAEYQAMKGEVRPGRPRANG